MWTSDDASFLLNELKYLYIIMYTDEQICMHHEYMLHFILIISTWILGKILCKCFCDVLLHYVARIRIRVSDTIRIGYDTYRIRYVSDTLFPKKHWYGDTVRIFLKLIIRRHLSSTWWICITNSYIYMFICEKIEVLGTRMWENRNFRG